MASHDSSLPWPEGFSEDGSDHLEAQAYGNEVFELPELQDFGPSLKNSILPARLNPAMNDYISSPRTYTTSQLDTVLGQGFGSYTNNRDTGLPASDDFFMRQNSTLQSLPAPLWHFPRSTGEIGNDNFGMGLTSTPATSPSGAISTPAQSSMNSSPPCPPMLAPTANRENRKRARDLLVTSPRDHTRLSKSMRATPSPAATRSGSPGSLDDPDFNELSRYLGPDVGKEMREMQEYENQLREEAKARREQEQRDWEMAQQLENELNSGLDASNSLSVWPTGTPQQIGRNVSQSYLDRSGNIQRALSVSNQAGYERPAMSLEGGNSTKGQSPSPYSFKERTSRSEDNHVTAGPSSFNPTQYTKAPWINNRSTAKAESSKSRGSTTVSRKHDNIGYMDLQDDSDSDVQIIEPDAFPRKCQPNSSVKKEPPMNNGIGWPHNPNDFGDLGDVPVMDLTGSSPVQQHATPILAGNWPAPAAFSDSYGIEGAGGGGLYGYGPPGAATTSSLFDPVRRGISSAAAAAYDMVDRALSGVPNFSSSSVCGPGTILQSSALAQQSYSRLGLSNPFDVSDTSTPLSDDFQGLDRITERMEMSNTAEDLKDLMNNIRPDEDLGADDRTGSPEDMADGAALYPHQKLGLAWMVKMEEGSNKGGILADDMGLGKHSQFLLFQAHNSR